ncbi:chorismate-binding protein [Rhizobium leguminosarum]|uniref:chorismate-binding protein n=1 Tax=Rhizobium leguminosarum TaxID=384 RepID=UPI001C955022|nr:chorismate-binding protein [Rhizobium leguminosarum]MBY5714896.1 TetR family transcriptional regulator [Rhizobium leguminosarum]
MEQRKHTIDRRVGRTQAAMHRALISLILDGGYDSITVEEICQTAKVGRSTFYLHYASKDDLKQSDLDSLRRQLVDSSARAMQRGGPREGFDFSVAMFEHARDHIEGATAVGAAELLRHTLLAPTVTGIPIKNACRVIAKYEHKGRGYYGGVVALIGEEELESQSLDSPILIRTAHISESGEVRIQVGSTIVRHSNPAQEAAETVAKGTGLLAAFTSANRPQLEKNHAVRRALAERNRRVAKFWLSQSGENRRARPMAGKVLLLDAEDDFTQTLAQQFKSLGLHR